MAILKSALKITTVLMAAGIMFSACAKDEPIVEDPEPEPVPADPPYFTWQLDGGVHQVADSTFALVQSHVIFAFKNVGPSLEINLLSMNTGTYIISSTTGNMLQYSDDQRSLSASSGTFVVTVSDAKKMSGNFKANFQAADVTSISGNFSDIPKREN